MEWQQKAKVWEKRWFEKYPVRLRKQQKIAFLDELEGLLRQAGFVSDRLNFSGLIKNRLLVTRCTAPKIILTAHYDTPTILPFWFGAVFRLLGHTRQIMGMVLVGAVLLLLPPWNLVFESDASFLLRLLALVQLVLIGSMVSLFIPNPRNREDNSSGVLGVMAIAEWLRDYPALRQHIQIAILDNEELGLLGSSMLKQYWQKQGHPYQEAMMINLDCISRGQIPLIIHHGRDQVAQALLPYLQTELPQTKAINMRLIPLSDNYTFRQHGAVDISFFDKTIVPGGYYIPDIHVPADNQFDSERFLKLMTGLTRFIETAVPVDPEALESGDRETP